MKLDVKWTGPKARVLDFDIECRPIAWYGGDFVTKQPTAIAWKFIGERGKVQCEFIGGSDRSSKVLEEEAAMLEKFVKAYDSADLVTGHYIRGFDLPVINGALMRLGMRPLKEQMAQDTKQDLISAQGVSKSMENLSAMFDTQTKKYAMDTAKWAAANMLLPHGIKFAVDRVMTDVIEHIELREIMLQNGLLTHPRLWRPEGSLIASYAP
jgi:hypothetical protein